MVLQQRLNERPLPISFNKENDDEIAIDHGKEKKSSCMPQRGRQWLSLPKRRILWTCLILVFVLANHLFYTIKTTATTRTNHYYDDFQTILDQQQHQQQQRDDDMNHSKSPFLNVFFILTTDESSFRRDNLRTMESVLFHHPNNVHIHIFAKSTRQITTKIIEPLLAQKNATATVFTNTTTIPPMTTKTGTSTIQLHRYHLPNMLETFTRQFDNSTTDQATITSNKFLQQIPRFERKDPNWHANEANIVRLIVLYCMGGVYLDTDMILVRPLTDLPSRHVVGMENWNADAQLFTVNNAVLMFLDPHNPFVYKALLETIKTFTPGKWGHNGPAALTRVLHSDSAYVDCIAKWMVEKEKKRTQTTAVATPTSSCSNPENDLVVELLPTVAFYPMHWRQVKQECFFGDLNEETSKQLLEKIQRSSYMVHTNNHVAGQAWNQLSHGKTKVNSMCHWLYNSFCKTCHGGIL